MVVRAGYGIYYDTSVYQTIANQMAQQSPLSKSLSVQNSAQTPLTLANGFIGSPNITPNTFAIDPNFRVGYAQNWQVSVQRDLPWPCNGGHLLGNQGHARATAVSAEYVSRRARSNPCPACPSGFAYLTSNGNSTRQAGRSSCAAGCAAASPRSFSTRIRNRSTMRRWAGEAREDR